jgi:hypothetical protein
MIPKSDATENPNAKPSGEKERFSKIKISLSLSLSSPTSLADDERTDENETQFKRTIFVLLFLLFLLGVFFLRII